MAMIHGERDFPPLSTALVDGGGGAHSSLAGLPLTVGHDESAPGQGGGGLHPGVSLTRALITTALVTCIAAGWVLLIECLVAGWRGDYLIVLTALVTLETLVAEQQWLLHPRYGTSRTSVRIAEFVIILILLKVAMYIQDGTASLPADIQAWIDDPLTLLTREYVLGIGMMLITWLLAIQIAQSLSKIENVLHPEDQPLGLAEFKVNFASGAYLLLLAVGLRHVITTLMKLPSSPSIAAAQTALPLVYLGLGLLLFAQSRLALLRTSWTMEEIPIDRRLGSRWLGWGLALVLAVTLLALLMPSANLYEGFFVLLWIFTLISFVASIFIALLMFLVVLLFSPLLALAGIKQSTGPLLPVTPLPPAPPPQLVSLDWLSQFRLLILFAVSAAVLFFVLRAFLRDRQALAGWGIFRVVLGWGKAVLAFLLGLIRRIHVPERAAPAAVEVSPARVGSWWQRWRAKTGRERVRRFYLTFLQRAAQAGHPRRADQTPLEYSAALEPYLEPEGENWQALTRAFIAARYGRHEFEPAEVNLLHTIWQRLSRALRHPLT